ncbi:MAG: RNA polymerase sigma factor SigZ [Gemmatimonadales bacterium]
MLRHISTRSVRLPVKPMRPLPETKESQLWQTYRAELLRFVLKRVRDKALAEDMVHDVFIKAHTRRSDLRDPGKLRPWLYQIARNTLVDYYRTQKPLQQLPEDLIGEEGGGDSHAEQELARCLLPLLDELPAGYRDALTLTEFEGLTQQEIALREGLSLSGAKSRVQRARRMLRELLLLCCRVEMDQRGGVVDYEPPQGCDCGGNSAGGLPNLRMEPTAPKRRGSCASR